MNHYSLFCSFEGTISSGEAVGGFCPKVLEIESPKVRSIRFGIEGLFIHFAVNFFFV